MGTPKQKSSTGSTEPAASTKPTDSELAAQLLAIFTKELNMRVGIGPIWRQLNQSRKDELLDKLSHDMAKHLAINR